MLNRSHVVAALTATTILGAAATSADADTAPTKITAPRAGALVASDSVAVRVTAPAAATRLSVFAGTTDVSKRFTHRGTVWTARLPRKLLKPGTNRLVVQSLKGKHSLGAGDVSFVVPSGRATQVSVASGVTAAAASVGSPGPAQGYTPSGSVPVSVKSATPTIAVLTVNGHRVDDLRRGRASKQHNWVVSALDGLKPGRNAFVLKTYDKNGRHSVRRWVVKRTAKTPLADAGAQERVTRPGKAIRLDATGSKTMRKGAQLTYAWRVVKAPKGAKPRLRNATSAKPTFVPDKPGVYQLALRATQTGGQPRAKAADLVVPATPTAPAVPAVPSSPSTPTPSSTTTPPSTPAPSSTAPAPSTATPPSSPAAASSTDVVTVDAAPAFGEQGLYINTALSDGGTTLTVGGQQYSFATTSGYDDFVQLDETTLAPVASGTHSAVTPKDGTVTIGAWQDVNGMPFTNGTFGSAVWIGTKLVALNDSINNTDPTAGNQNTTLTGWIKPGTTNTAHTMTTDATWVGSDMRPTQTRSKGDTATTNTMVVGSTSYPVSLPSGATGGYELQELDNDGDSINSRQLYALDGDAADDLATQTHLADALNGEPADVTTLLQAFGTVPAPSANLAAAIQALGGRSDVVSRFNGKGDASGGVYALISAPYTDPSSGKATIMAEENSSERTGTGSLNALLVRDSQQNDLIPLDSDNGTPDPVDVTAGAGRMALVPLVYSAPTPWSQWVPNGNGGLRAGTTAENAALADIITAAGNAGYIPTKASNDLCPNSPDRLRGAYCNASDSDLSILQDNLGRLTFNSALAAKDGYPQADFTTAQNAVEDEAGHASQVRSLLNTYQTIYGKQATAGTVDANQIGTQINGVVKQETATTNANMFGLVSSLTDMMSGFPDDLAPMWTFLSGTFGLDSQVLPNSGAADLPDQVTVTQASAAGELLTDYENASGQLAVIGDYLASDPMKLIQAGPMAMRQYAVSGDTEYDAQYAGEYAAQQFLWGTIMAPAYRVWTGPTDLGTNPMCVLANQDNAIEGNPMSNFDPKQIWTSGTDQWWLALNSSKAPYQDGVAVPKSITDLLFSPFNPSQAPGANAKDGHIGPVGAVMPYFAQQYLTPANALPKDQGQPHPPTILSGCYSNSNY